MTFLLSREKLKLLMDIIVRGNPHAPELLKNLAIGSHPHLRGMDSHNSLQTFSRLGGHTPLPRLAIRELKRSQIDIVPPLAVSERAPKPPQSQSAERLATAHPPSVRQSLGRESCRIVVGRFCLA